MTGDAPASAAIYDRGGVDWTARDNLFDNISIRDGLLATNPPHGELIEVASSGDVLIENNELDASATNNGVQYFNATDLATLTVRNNNFTTGSGFDHLATGFINTPLDVSGNWYGVAGFSGTTNDGAAISPLGPGQNTPNVVNASAPVVADVGPSCAPADVDFSWDLKFCSLPNAFNCKRTRGNVPLTIFGSADLDVSQIDISSLRLALASNPATTTGAPTSTLPLADRGSPGEVDAKDDDCVANVATTDGLLDLDVGFSAAEVAGLIGCPLAKKAFSPALIVTGTLLNGTTILEALNDQVLRN